MAAGSAELMIETTTPASPEAGPEAGRGVWRSMARGLRGRCPACGEGRLMRRYLQATPACGHCREGYAHLRAAGLPPRLTINIVGHLIMPLLLLVVQPSHPAPASHVPACPALTVASPPTKTP